jgi:transposase-like protein
MESGQEILTMKRSEIKRFAIIEKVIKKELKQIEAAEVLGISDRQVRRLVIAVRARGEAGIIHGLRGKESHRKISNKIRDKILRLCRGQYEGFGPLFAAEKLKERDGITVSKETLRQWLIKDGLWQVKRGGKKKHLQWRERKAHHGQMLQMDGSHHAWLEDRGPVLALMGLIDDATGQVSARFYEYEGTIPAMDSLKRYIQKHGIPASVYLDKHTTYKSSAKETIEEELEDRKPLSQFEKACAKIGIEVIHANSPQAKGRVERLFRTLQDRLVKELRLANVKTLNEANVELEKVLISFNKQFSVTPRELGDLHRKVPSGVRLNEVFLIETSRTLRNDNTIAHQKQWYQISTPTRVKKVVLQEHLDGSLRIVGNGKNLEFKRIKQPSREYKPKVRLKTRRLIPGIRHPWRGYWVGKT